MVLISQYELIQWYSAPGSNLLFSTSSCDFPPTPTGGILEPFPGKLVGGHLRKWQCSLSACADHQSWGAPVTPKSWFVGFLSLGFAWQLGVGRWQSYVPGTCFQCKTRWEGDDEGSENVVPRENLSHVECVWNEGTSRGWRSVSAHISHLCGEPQLGCRKLSPTATYKAW